MPLRFHYEYGAAFSDRHPKILVEYAVSKWRPWGRKRNLRVFLRREELYTTAHMFQLLGRKFETRGDFETAASVYELGTVLSTYSSRKGCMHCCAGVGYRRAFLFRESEFAMREHILLPPVEGRGRTTATLRHLNNPAVANTLTNLLGKYASWRIRGEGSLAEPWICVLLAPIGFAPDPNEACRLMSYHYLRNIILKKLSKEKARNHLIEVLQCTAAEDFHA